MRGALVLLLAVVAESLHQGPADHWSNFTNRPLCEPGARVTGGLCVCPRCVTYTKHQIFVTCRARCLDACNVETECSPCGGYYRTGADQWISKDRHDSPHVFETLQPGDPFSNYSE